MHTRRCVLAEMVGLTPLFAGADSADQLFLMFKALGTPTIAGEFLCIKNTVAWKQNILTSLIETSPTMIQSQLHVSISTQLS